MKPVALLLALVACAGLTLVFLGRDTAPGAAAVERTPRASPTADTPAPTPMVAPEDGPAREAAPSPPSKPTEQAPRAAPPQEEEVASFGDTEPDSGLLVHVRSSDGGPAAQIPVGFYVLIQGSPAPMIRERKPTDAEGLAQLDFDLNAEVFTQMEAQGVEVAVGIDLDLEPPVRRSLTRADLPLLTSGGAIELDLPAGAEELGGPLRVLVVDAAGAPAAGVEVGYAFALRGSEDDDHDLVEGVTGPDGLAELDRDRAARMRGYLEGQRQPYERRVAARGPFQATPYLVVSATEVEASARNPVRLQLEPTGALEVEVLGPDGERIVEGARVQLSWTRPGEERRDGFRWLELERGFARVEHIGCGLELSLSASVSGSDFKSVGEARPGPATQGELVRAALRFGERHPLLVGRLVDAAGQPLPDLRFALEHDYSVPREPSNAQLRSGPTIYAESDAEGRFELPWYLFDWAQPERKGARILHLVERAATAGSPDQAFARAGRVVAPRPDATARRYELGDVELGPMPLLVRGQVLGPDREARSARVRVQYCQALPGAASGESPGESWYNLEQPSTDAEGRFELRSHLPYRRLRLSAWQHKGGQSEAVEFAPGTQGVRLVLAPAEARPIGTLNGRILADEDIPWAGLEAYLVSVADSSDQEQYVFGGFFRFSEVRPGSYRLQVRAGGSGYDGPDFELCEPVAVEVLAGRDNQAPEIDLRGRLAAFELTLLDPEGERLHRVRAHLAADGRDLGGGWVDRGRLAFVAPLEVAELDSLELRVGEYAPAPLVWDGEPQTIRLH